MLPIRQTRTWLPNIFNDFFGNEWMENVSKSSTPAVNILEKENEFQVEVAAPGMTKEDVNLRLDEDNNLLISLEKKVEKEEKDEDSCYLRREFSYTNFQRRMILPENVERDAISAKVKDGVLCIVIPKRHEEEEPKKEKIIEIQ